MDFIDGFLVSKGKSVLLVVVDRLSKYSYFILLTHPYSALTVAQAFLDNVYKLYGLPKVIVSDRDTVFLSRFWTELFKLLQVGLHMSTAYHPQTDGQTEVGNRCVECYLRCMTGDKPKEWVQWIPLAEYYANESVDKSLVAREAVVKLLKFHLLRAQDRMKVIMANKKRSERVFRIDDLVLLKLKPYMQSTLRQHKHHKLASKYYGPFKIIARIGEVAYKLDLSCDPRRVIALEPFAVLNRRMAKRGNVAAIYVLIQWSNESVDDDAWELYDDIAVRC
ncbi:retrotransposon-related protein [Tanacetum coccineum]